MKKLKIFLLSSLIVLILGLGLAVYLSRVIKTNPQALITNLPPGISQGKDIHITQDKWEIFLQNVRYAEQGGAANCQKVKLVYHNEDGRDIVLEGDEGKVSKINTDNLDVEIKGNIVITTTDGYILKTDSLKYYAKKKYVTSSDLVRITGPGWEVQGRGLKGDLDQEKFYLKEDVITEIKPQNEET